MKPGSRVETFARDLRPPIRLAVRNASAAKIVARDLSARAFFGDDLEAARERAASIKDAVIDGLGEWMALFIERAEANGTRVHVAEDAQEACRIALELIGDHAGPGDVIAKAKSMATEEIHLNAALEGAGYRVVETDLGEFIVQLDHDAPSHIVTPIIHKTRYDVAETFAREGLGPYSEDPETLTMQARAHLRDRFREAKVGISGVNFAVAESGTLVLIENEGNNRFCTTAPRIHIAIMGIEKLLPRDADVPLFLRLLGLSATGQQLTTYTHFIRGPRRPDEPDGPDEVHVILLDNGRSALRDSPYRAMLRCIRCGACLNACPVYRQASGHAYGHVYSGPLGAVLAPAMFGLPAFGDLAHASTLCGACESVCPVKIPIPDLLLRLREEGRRDRGSTSSIDWTPFVHAARHPDRWRGALNAVRFAPNLGPMRAWTSEREPPQADGESFRRWWRGRS